MRAFAEIPQEYPWQTTPLGQNSVIMKPTLCKVLSVSGFAVLAATCLSQEYSAVPTGSFDPAKMEMHATMCPAAVSEINGKINYSGGNMNSDEGHNFDGSITFPIMRHFGFNPTYFTAASVAKISTAARDVCSGATPISASSDSPAVIWIARE